MNMPDVPENQAGRPVTIQAVDWLRRTIWGGLFKTRSSRFSWITALDEPVLITTRNGRVITVNQSCKRLAQTLWPQQSGPVSPGSADRMFSAVPGLAEPVSRLSRAAANGEKHTESLPAIMAGNMAEPVRYEASVVPLDDGCVIWRLCPPEGKPSGNAGALDIENAPIGFFSSRPDGKVLWANGWIRELDRHRDGKGGLHVHDIMAQEHARSLDKNRTTSHPQHTDIVLRADNGKQIPAHAVTFWTGTDNHATGWTVVFADKARNLSSPSPCPDGNPMFDLAPFGAARICGKTFQDAIITDNNRALITLTNGKASPGTRLADLFITEEGTDRLYEKQAGSPNKPVSMQLADDNQTHVNVFVALDRSGQPTAAYIIDMSAQKELELRLAQSEKMQLIGKLAGGIAHDFNNVLTGIMLNNDHLRALHQAGDPSFEHLKSIHEFSLRARNLVRMLLAYARQQTFRREVLEPRQFLSEFSILLKQLLDERIRFSVEHGRNLPAIKVDKNQLETAIINLATNARDALLMDGGTGGKLVIRTSRSSHEDAHRHGFRFVEEGEYLLIEVEDNGHGIAAEHLKNIFTPFFTTKPKGHGTGLGLSSVYGIIKQSEGYVCPISTPGKGTTFQIYLPALKAEDIPAPRSQKTDTFETTPADVSGRGKILLVEDEEGVRAIVASQLQSRGYEVEQACDGQDALKILQDNPCCFDLILSDVVMPGMDGPTLIREARDLLGKARVLLMSGYAESDTAAIIDNDHKVAFIPKPFTVKQLVERVKQELSSKTDALT